MIDFSKETLLFIFSLGYSMQTILLQDYLVYYFCEEELGHTLCSNLSANQLNSSVFADRIAIPGNETLIGRAFHPEVIEDEKMQNIYGREVVYYMAFILSHYCLALVVSLYFTVRLNRYSKKGMMIMSFVGQVACTMSIVVSVTVPSLSLGILMLGAVISGASGGYPLLKAIVLDGVLNPYSTLVEPWAVVHLRLLVMEFATFFGGCVGLFFIRLVVNFMNYYFSTLFLCTMLVFITGVCYIFAFSHHLTNEDIYENLPGSTTYPPIRQVQNEGYRTFGATRAPGTVEQPQSYLLNTLVSTVQSVFAEQGPRTNFVLKVIFATSFLNYVLLAVEIDLSYVYLRSSLNLNLEEYTTFSSINLFVATIVLLVGAPIMKTFIGMTDLGTATLASFSRLGFFLFLAFGLNGRLIYLAIPINAFSQLLPYSEKSVLAKLLTENHIRASAFIVLNLVELGGVFFGSLVFNALMETMIYEGNTQVTMIVSSVVSAILMITFCSIHFLSRLQFTPNSGIIDGSPGYRDYGT